MFSVLLALATHPCHAADDGSVDAKPKSGLWMKQAIGTGGFPTGLISETKMQYRTPGPRSDSIVFQDTYLGAGAAIAVSPAFFQAGPTVSIAPIDVFDLDLGASWIGYFDNGLGLMPFDEASGKLGSDRDARAAKGEGVGANAVALTATPTLKLKLGPIVAFDSWEVSYVHFDQPEGTDSLYTYEPQRDLLLAWEDVAIEHQAAVIYTIMPGDDGPKLWVGGTVRDRFAAVSPDRSTAAGAVIIARPGTKPAIPQIVGQSLWYLNDADRSLGSAPNLQAQVSWTFE